MSNLFSLKDKVALVTGASGGIGSAIVRAFHEAGATVIISGTRENVLKELEHELGTRVHSIVCDLSDKEQCANLVKAAVEMVGRLDILVCNAGLTKDGLAMRMSDEDFEKVIRINLQSTFTLNREAIRPMMKNGYGRIINISSVVAVAGNAGQANYCASKAGMIGMTKAIAQEIGIRGLTANTIAPGFIETPMTDGLKDELKQKMVQKISMGRFGKPEEIAASALFLASEAASYITGQTIHVNGGMIMV